MSQTLQNEKSPEKILRATQRIEHLTRRIKNLLIWPNLTEIPVDVQNLADEALCRLPSIINDLRRKSDLFRMDEIEKSLMKLHISPVPVSYTHLDVYKRQALNCGPLSDTIRTGVP